MNYVTDVNLLADKRVLLTDEWLYVKGCEDMYAIRDCALSWNQRAKVSEVNALLAHSNNLHIGDYVSEVNALLAHSNNLHIGDY
ncbi:hypothetical protein Prudu_009163, partial [Prunus dulcis]